MIHICFFVLEKERDWGGGGGGQKEGSLRRKT